MMNPSIRTNIYTILLLLLTSIASSSSSQQDLSDYCYKESTDLGICLGRQQQYFHVDLSLEQIEKCLECSGNFRGDESCTELKSLNNGNADGGGDSAAAAAGGGGDEVEGSDGDAGFCETYNHCVETNCPKECWDEQDRWLECLVIELDCDWTCPRADPIDTMVSASLGNGASGLGRGGKAILIVSGLCVSAYFSLF